MPRSLPVFVTVAVNRTDAGLMDSNPVMLASNDRGEPSAQPATTRIAAKIEAPLIVIVIPPSLVWVWAHATGIAGRVVRCL
jgi:hypothetical protein